VVLGVVWSQLLRNRSDLPALAQVAPDLARRLDDRRRQLDLDLELSASKLVRPGELVRDAQVGAVENPQ